MTRVTPAKAGAQFVEGLEVLDIPGEGPEILLLHEGLGSVSMWRDFPSKIHEATGRRVVAYSRAGFGRSAPRTRPYTSTFIHEEAGEAIPKLREALAIDRPVLLGHSTGASMGLVHASLEYPVAGVIAMAPLTTVEGSNVESIQRARSLYESSDWRSRLARHHDDVDAVFYGWNDTWLRPDFRDWNILAEIGRVRVPVLAILGEGDEYASPLQVAAIGKSLPRGTKFESLVLSKCGHAPHRDQPGAVLQAVRRFVAAL